MKFVLLSSDDEVKVSDHLVIDRGAVIEINCSYGQELWSSTDNDTDSLSFPFVVTVDSSSKQGKYVCIDQEKKLKEIHYIFIPGIS